MESLNKFLEGQAQPTVNIDIQTSTLISIGLMIIIVVILSSLFASLINKLA